MKELSYYTGRIMELVENFAPKLLLALVTLIIGTIFIRKLSRLLTRYLKKKSDDLTLITFLCSLLKVMLFVILFIAVAGIVGIQTTSLITVMGAAGLAIGLALQGSLANFAGGVLILFFRPFKVGDVIEAQGYIGKVYEIQIFNTILKTFDNRRIILPNGTLANNPILNITHEEKRRIDMEFGISYSDDFNKAKSILIDLIKADERIINDPEEPFVALKELGDSAVIFVVRAWCMAENYWNIYFEMQEKVKTAFDRESISIPFPQRDVHVYNENKK